MAPDHNDLGNRLGSFDDCQSRNDLGVNHLRLVMAILLRFNEPSFLWRFLHGAQGFFGLGLGAQKAGGDNPSDVGLGSQTPVSSVRL